MRAPQDHQRGQKPGKPGGRRWDSNPGTPAYKFWANPILLDVDGRKLQIRRNMMQASDGPDGDGCDRATWSRRLPLFRHLARLVLGYLDDLRHSHRHNGCDRLCQIHSPLRDTE